MNLVAEVIEGQQSVEEHQFAIWQREIVLGMFANRFHLANHVVRKIADRSGSEWRQAGYGLSLIHISNEVAINYVQG